MKKGDPLYVEGRLQYRAYQDEEGKERGVAEIVASDVQFLSSRRMEAAGAPANSGTEPTPSPTPDPGREEVGPEEIPF